MRHRDTLELTSPAFRTWYAGGYETLVRKSPTVWRALYRLSDRPHLTFQFQTLLDRVFCRSIESLVSETNPAWVICTHSLPQPVLAALRPRYGFKMAVCVTDLHPHLMWLRGQPDRYFVPLDETARRLSARDPGARWRTLSTGIPIHPCFRPGPPPPEPVVLVSSGGIGAGPVAAAAKALSALDCRVVVITGRNDKLLRGLQDAGLPGSVELAGRLSIQEMAERMSRASLMVCKAGGLTTFESFACGLPMLIYRPFLIPGQEEDNARFVVEAGAGRMANDLDELRNSVQELLRDPAKLASMRRAALANAKPDAARSILESFLK